MHKSNFPKHLLLMLCCLLVFCGALFTSPHTAKASEDYSNRYWFNEDSGYAYIIDDQADLFASASDAQFQSLLKIMETMSAYTNVVFYSSNENPYSSVSTLASSYCDTCFGSNAVNAVAFVFDMANRDLYLYISGDLSYTIRSSDCNTIADNVYRMASKGDYITCATTAYEQANRLVMGDGIPQPMKYISNAFLAVILAMLANFFFVRTASNIRRPRNEELLDGIYRKTEFNNSKASFDRQTKTYSPQSSGSSSGGGGRSGGGGGHSSGGGHHF